MGIKGVYQQIGPGTRVSLSKLAVSKLNETGRPLRLAIDISIWQFQVQAAKGGSNPAIRTLFYRLVRLLGLGIHPIFVFDGSRKPTFKRNKRSGRSDGVATAMAKRLIRLFGFRAHDAPGEAEAECALLQLHGVVDAVLSEDVDTLMFGCTRSLRNWTAEGTRGNKTPTHVSLYDAAEIREGGSGLDREGMVLVALMSGGDYLPEGIPGCGPKLACEAARAGFGKSLCRIKRSDAEGLREWKTTFAHELRTNESRFFRTKHQALAIPSSFPNFEVLRYYTHPVVSAAEDALRLRDDGLWRQELDVAGLRAFVGETFDWVERIGTVKFIRVLAPHLLAKKMLDRGAVSAGAGASAIIIESAEKLLVKRITGRRSHPSTDGTPEVRISYIPADVVGIPLEDEAGAPPASAPPSFGRTGLALNSDDEWDDPVGELAGAAASGSGPSSKKDFDPLAEDLAWIPEKFAQMGVPFLFGEWEDSQRQKAIHRGGTKTSKASRGKGGKGGITHPGPLDHWVKITKPSQGAGMPKNTAVVSTSWKDAGALPVRLAQKPQDPAGAATNKPASAAMRSKQPKNRRGATAALAVKAPPATTKPRAIAGSQLVPSITKPGTALADPIALSSSPAGPETPAPHPPVKARRTSVQGEGFILPPALSPSPPWSSRAPARATPSSPSTQGRTARRGLMTPGMVGGRHTQTSIDTAVSLSPKSRQSDGRPRKSRAYASNKKLFVQESDQLHGHPDVTSGAELFWIVDAEPIREAKNPAPSHNGRAPLEAPRDQTMKAFVSRMSHSGCFKEVGISLEEADELLVEADGLGSLERHSIVAAGHNELTIIDLTGDD